MYKQFTLPMLKSKHLTKSLLAAAAALVVGTTAASAYNTTGWNTTSYTSGSTYAYGPYYTGGGAWVGNTSSSVDSLFGGSMDLNLVYSGLYNVSGLVNWSNNRYGVNTPDGAYVQFSVNLVGQQSASWGANADYSWRSSAYFLPINNASLRVDWQLQGDNGTWVNAGYYQLTERNVQVARTGAGLNGQSATSAFALDNQSYGSNYSVYSSRNVLSTVSVNNINLAANVGSVVRNGDIQLGNLGANDALFAKDAGWLDIRGSLTISSGLGQVYIRDAEITSTIFTDNNAYGSAQARTQDNFFFDSGILSVRNRFAQDMYVSGQQTIAFRDGAVNASNLYIDGYGYTRGSTGPNGSLRSISGSNVQNGSIGIGWNGTSYSYIGVDSGSTLTINGTINGVNGVGSGGGSTLSYYVDGQLVQNGTIASGVNYLHKWGSGEVRLNSANTYSADTLIHAGTLTVGNADALSGSDVYVYNSGTLAFDTGSVSLGNYIALSNGSAIHVRSGDVALTNVVTSGSPVNTTWTTDTGTSLTMPAGVTWLSFGFGTLAVNTAAGSFVDLQDAALQNLTLNKTGAGILKIAGDSPASNATVNVLQGTTTVTDCASFSAFVVSDGASLVLSNASLYRTWAVQVQGNGDSSNGYHGAVELAAASTGYVHDTILLGDTKYFVGKQATLTMAYVYDRASVIPSTLTIFADSDAHGANYGRVSLYQILDPVILNKAGEGVLEITGAGVQAATNVQAGILAAEHDDALGTYVFGATNVSSGASLLIASSNVHGRINLLGGNGYGVHTWNTGLPWRALNFWNNSGQDGLITIYEATGISKLGFSGSTGTLRGNITSAVLTSPTLAFHVEDGTLAVTGNIDSSIGAITKYGNGTTLAVSGNINTTSDLNVNEGTVVLSGTASNVNVNVASGATLKINANNVFFNSASSGLTNVDVASGASLILGDNGSAVTDTILQLTGSGNVSLLNGSTLNVLSGNYTGVVQSTGALVKDGASNTTLILTNASTYLGGTTVQGGTLNLTNVGSLTSNVVVANGGKFVANGHVLADLANSINGNVTVNAGGLLKGSGSVAGNVVNSGVVAPGNSPGILTVNGGYTESGTLQIEIGGTDGAGVNPTGHDQIHVTGGNYAITAGVATLQLSKYNAFEPARRDSFLAVNVDAPHSIVGTYHTLDRSSFTTQLFFDHSNGKVYGSGLTEAQTFAEYGLTNANRRAVGYALYQDGLITALTVKNGAGSATAAKAFVNGSTDLGAAVESLLLAADPATVLDALSPEAYAGLGDASGRVSRAHFSTLGSALNGASKDWDFSVGYTDQRFRTGTSMTTLDQQMTNSSTHVSANKAFGNQCGLALLLSDERGHVNASNFGSSVTGWSAGIAGSYQNKDWNFQVGYVHTDGSADVVRNGAAANDIGVRADSLQLKVTQVQKPDAKATYVVTPYAALTYTHTKSGAATETSPGANLSVDAISSGAAYAEVGMDVLGKFSPDLQWNLTAALSTSLNGSQTDVTARFADAGVGATAFTVRSGGVHGLEAKLGASLVKDFGAGTRGEIGVLGEIGSNFSNAIRFDAKVSKRF